MKSYKNDFFEDENERSFYQIYELENTEYVDLQPMDKKNVVLQYSYRLIDFSNLLGKNVVKCEEF